MLYCVNFSFLNLYNGTFLYIVYFLWIIFSSFWTLFTQIPIKKIDILQNRWRYIQYMKTADRHLIIKQVLLFFYLTFFLLLISYDQLYTMDEDSFVLIFLSI